MGRAIGIDLGTTNSIWAVHEPVDTEKASAHAVPGGQQRLPSQSASMFLKLAREEAELRLGEEVTGVVLTVPAYFMQAQIAATRQAAEEAGLRVLRVLDEPTAVAIAYGMDGTEYDDEDYILVYDLGGSTFDISVLRRNGDGFTPLASEGDKRLGGDNFDQYILDRVVDHIEEKYGVNPRCDPQFMEVLRKASRAAKERLSTSPATEVVASGVLHTLDGDSINVNVKMPITRQEFEQLIRTSVLHTLRLTELALNKAGLGIDQKDDPVPREKNLHVLLAGSSTRVPLVQHMLEEKFGADRVKMSAHPESLAAIGAAKVAADLLAS